MGRGFLTFFAMGIVAVVALRSLVVYRRRAHDAKADLTVSDTWLAEQRSRAEEPYR
jgi:hypothetical protein